MKDGRANHQGVRFMPIRVWNSGLKMSTIAEKSVFVPTELIFLQLASKTQE